MLFSQTGLALLCNTYLQRGEQTVRALRMRIGEVGLDHFAISVRPGQLSRAVELFVELFGWEEDENAAVGRSWGEARFVSPPGGGVRLQLTEPAVTDGKMLPTVHPAFQVDDPALVAEVMVHWAYPGGLKGRCEKLPGGKWFVYLTTIFTVAIELVPRS